MATTIQTIEVPKKARALDTSGNNNHGQIYSGRGLEFDGVTDYLDLGSNITVSTGAWTVACWVNTANAAGSIADNIIGVASNLSAAYLGISDSLNLAIYDWGGTSWRESDTSMELNTWYRAVFSYDGSGTLTFYLNGVADGTVTLGTTGDNDDLIVRYIGCLSNQSRLLDGKMSDLQLWDAALTQSDVTYDYLNPESLALNNGGTALTESNLKLWYPMQDGHRGQQSYILDGANTGLGVELITDGDFPSETTAWSFGGGWSLGDGVASGVAGSGSKLTQTNTLNGKFCKVTFTVSNYEGTSLVLVDFGSVSSSYITSNGTHTVYGTYDQNNFEIYKASGFSGDITNISVKAINDKNHATTVFHGDELVANGNCEVTDPATVTINSVAFTLDDATYDDSTEQANGGSKSLKITADSSSVKPEVKFLDGDAMGLVVGRTYKFSVDAYLPAGLDMDQVRIKAMDNGGSEITETHTSTTGSWVTLSITFVNDDITSLRVFGYNGGAAVNNESYYIDNISVKEVGAASGWTDADQQLHIPQTALQSYNELAWFDGEADYVDINPSTAIWNGSDGEWNSVSCWVNETGLDSGIFYWDLGFKPGLYVKISGSNHTIGYNTGNGEQFGITIASTSIINKWNHWVMNWKRNSNDDDTAISGSDVELFLNGVKQTLSYVAGSSSNSCDTSTTKDINLMSVGSNYFTNGTITEVSAWKDQLTDAEVLELFNDGKALDALTHSNANLSAYWRNNGLSTWANLVNPGTNDGTPTSVTETILIPQGVDSTRDNQGFIMNRQKDTSCFNSVNNGLNDGTSYEAGVAVADSSTLDITGDFSICLWVKLADKNNKYNIIQKKTAWNGEGYGLYYHGSNDKWFFEYANSSNNKQLANANLTMDLDTWYFICVTHNDSGNDVQYQAKYNSSGMDQTITHGSALASVGTNDESLSIGQSVGGSVSTPGTTFSGQLDGVLIYNKTLDAAEVLRNFNATKSSHRN